LATGGGHAMAAGFSLDERNLRKFHEFLDERMADSLTRPRAADLAVEGTLAVAGCTTELAGHLQRLAPFGNGNEEPMLALPRARIVRADRIGKEGATIRAFLEGEGGEGRLKAIMFRAKEGPVADALLARSGAPLHFAGHLRAETWNGATSASFIVSDVAAVSSA
jgi:single-stranded-DNA-specific exonuclease